MGVTEKHSNKTLMLTVQFIHQPSAQYYPWVNILITTCHFSQAAESEEVLFQDCVSSRGIKLLVLAVIAEVTRLSASSTPGKITHAGWRLVAVTS